MKDRRKKELKKLFKKSEIESFKTESPLSIDQLSDLIKFLEDKINETKCDGTFSKTYLYIKKIGINDSKTVLNWLRDQGCFCDCEVLNLDEKCDINV